MGPAIAIGLQLSALCSRLLRPWSGPGLRGMFAMQAGPACIVYLLLAWNLPLRADSAIAHGPILVINNLAGDDTAASGSPADITAISAVATCHTNGLASTIIQWPGNGFLAGGVPTGFKALLWLNTPAGRRWTEINTYDAGTVTVEDSFTIALAGAVDCAVGGKRRTLAQTGFPSVDSGQLFADVKGTHALAPHGWQVNMENAGGPYGQNISLTATAGPGCIFQGVAGSSLPPTTVVMTIDATTWTPAGCDVRNIHFQNSAVAKTASIALQLNASANANLVQNNIVGGPGVSTGHFIGIQMQGGGGNVFANEVRSNTTGISGAEFLNKILWNYIHGNGTGYDLGNCSLGGTVDNLLFRNLIIANTGAGVSGSNANCALTATFFVENTIDGNGGDGLAFAGVSAHKTLLNNQITNNGGFGVSCTAGTDGCESLNDKGIVAYNNFFGNALGARSNWPVGESESAANPQYVNTGLLNWCVNNTTTQGGPPGVGEFFPGSATASFLVPGACQPAGGSGGGSGCCSVR